MSSLSTIWIYVRRRFETSSQVSSNRWNEVPCSCEKNFRSFHSTAVFFSRCSFLFVFPSLIFPLCFSLFDLSSVLLLFLLSLFFPLCSFLFVLSSFLFFLNPPLSYREILIQTLPGEHANEGVIVCDLWNTVDIFFVDLRRPVSRRGWKRDYIERVIQEWCQGPASKCHPIHEPFDSFIFAYYW